MRRGEEAATNTMPTWTPSPTHQSAPRQPVLYLPTNTPTHQHTNPPTPPFSTRRKEEAEQRFSELKASGIGSTELNREISDELNHKVSLHLPYPSRTATHPTHHGLSTHPPYPPRTHPYTNLTRPPISASSTPDSFGSHGTQGDKGCLRAPGGRACGAAAGRDGPLPAATDLHAPARVGGPAER